jgi:hypothetical protein
VIGKRRSGFIQRSTSGAAQGLDDLYELLLRDGKVADRSVEREGDMQPVEEVTGLLLRSLPVHAPGHGSFSHRKATEMDVFNKIQIGQEAQFLVDGCDAGPVRVCRRTERPDCTIEKKRSSCWCDGPGKDLYERALAGAFRR